LGSTVNVADDEWEGQWDAFAMARYEMVKKRKVWRDWSIWKAVYGRDDCFRASSAIDKTCKNCVMRARGS